MTKQPTAYTVSAIEAQTKRPDRYSIFLNGTFWCGLSAQGLLDSKLKKGDELSRQQAIRLKQQAKTDALFNRMLQWLSLRPRSTWEVEQYLRRKEASQATINDFIEELAHRELLNDDRFAQSWVEHRRLLKPISRRKLQLELKEKRISDDIIEHVLQQDDTDDVSVIKELIIKKRQQSRYRDETKLLQYLSRQGFHYSDIRQALDELVSQ